MPKSSCPKCGHNQFESEMYKAQESETEFTLVQCTQCGTVVGVDFNYIRELEWKDLIGRVKRIEEILERMQ